MCTPARNHLAAFFSLTLVLATCFTAGCSTQTPVPQANEISNVTDFGFRTETTTQAQPAIRSFKEITTDIVNLRFDTGNGNTANASPQNQILYAHGIDLNGNGETGKWTFAVLHDTNTSIVTYDQYGRTVVDWSGIFPRKEIRTYSIITPEDLFLKNRATIIGSAGDSLAESRDLVLSMSNYTLTISGKGATRVLEFDAETGALKSSHD